MCSSIVKAEVELSLPGTCAVGANLGANGADIRGNWRTVAETENPKNPAEKHAFGQ